MTGHFVSGVAMLCTVLGFLYGRYNSMWIPYPRYNKLSWGFVAGIISLIFILISFFTMLVFYLKIHSKSVKARILRYRNAENVGEDDDDDDNVPEDDDRNVTDEIERLASTSASQMYSSQPGGYLQPRIAGSQFHADSVVVENFENEDYDEDGIYPYES
ncbi:unnamed protein product [Rodentolepis nana]|uniref:Transmembrane protein n=1 Tax=Rodentolepis nana TaxID=102285 RepID=A0A0R3TM43_RODNA|nr:unnamed protein product [Rodentolepis nana]